VDWRGKRAHHSTVAREHANLWGLLRCTGCCLVIIVCGAKAGIVLPEDVLERAVQHRRPDIEKGCTVILFHRICCFLFMRLATISLTALSTNAVEIGSPYRLRVDLP
jgi:hypothetical protein